MRWDHLFSDLESQLEFGLTAEEDDLHAEEERLRLGRLTIRDRVLALVAESGRGADYPIVLQLSGGLSVSISAATVGKDWLAAELDPVSPRARAQGIVPLVAIAGISLSRRQVRHSLEPRAATTPAGSIGDRLALPFVLRDLCRRRAAVEVVLRDEALFGTIDRVGRDHFDLAVHEPGTPRRESALRSLRVVALDAVVLFRV